MRKLLVDLESSVEGRGSWRLRAKRLFIGRRRRAVAVALLVAVVAAGGWLLLQRPGAVRSGNLALAVMDFEDLGGSGDTLAAAGLNGLLQVGLIEKSPIRVVSPEYLQELHRRLFNGAIGVIKPERATEVARKAGASFILSGQLGGQKGSTYVIWRLIETGRGRSVGGRRVAYSDIVGLADEIIAEVVPLIAKQAGIDTSIATGSVEQITSSSPEALRHFTAAEAIFEGGNLDEALRQLEIAVRLDSTFALAWLRMADFCIWWSAQPQLAKKYVDKAWEHRSRLGIKDRMRLDAIKLQNDSKQMAAFEVYEEMVERWPDDRSVLFHYAVALYYNGLMPEAEEASEKALARFPDDAELRVLRVQALMEQGKAAKALAALHELQERDPEETYWEMAGRIHLIMGAIDSAEAAFRHADSLDPDDFQLQFNLAACEFSRGRPMEAAAMWERLLLRSDLSPYRKLKVMLGDIQVIYGSGLINCYAEVGCLNRALKLFDEIDPEIFTSVMKPGKRQYVRGLFLLHWGRPDSVLAMTREMMKQQEVGQDRTLWLDLRTYALIDLDSVQAARACLAQRAKEEYRRELFRHDYHYQAALIALRDGRPDSALVHLDASKYPGFVDTYDTRVRALRALKRFPEAAATLEELLRISGSRFIARYQLGQIYEEMGRKADAARQYEIFLKAWENADPGWPQVEDARKRLAALRSTAPK
jgi:tetratricopeptide (TPR) repeat protein/TolB-like protein